jgi:hypothetical protein
MKKVYFIGFILALPLFTFAQNEPATTTIDERLYAVFEADFLERLQSQSPAQLQYYNFFLDNIYEIKELPKGKTSSYPTVAIPNLNHINILKLINDLELKRDYNSPTVYSIANTNKLLVIISEKEFVKKFNEATGRTHN